MNIVDLAQIVGIISIFIIFCLKFYIAVVPSAFVRAGRAAILWFTIYVFFLFILRLFFILHIGTPDGLRIVSGFATLIPLLGIVFHLFIAKKVENATTERKMTENQL